ncbi:ABC-2 type transport system ATP-binding protein [Microbacterium trichothecenolyticum]|uniref:ABC transporter ATP-binding protein n=1 Tax=Microbacterium trichothecenolyticum TaxID=69370 RepID=UPI0028581FC3|nr:ATP-binding cassette domain-containing protein [Microbacterium trichothecenolyticum]MDR7186478.1 ABC-2 type transport system ATP-binding protein [Microbacterium trichothecenolyticum]
MTASLPVPNDIDPEEPDRHSSARVVRLADTVSPAPDKPRRPPRKPRTDGGSQPAAAPRKKRTPAASKPKPAPAPDPGPPPPLPSDLELAASAAARIVVPPRPPLPDAGDASPADAARTAPVEEATPVDDGAATDDVATEAEPEPAIEAEPQAEPEAAIEPETPVVPEPAAESEADVEHTTLAETAAVVDAEPVVESAPVAEPAGVVEPTPAVEPSVAPAEPDAAVLEHAPAPAELQPVPLPAPAPEPTTTLDPEALAAAVSLDAAATAAAASANALVLRGVTKRFGSTHAVDGIDLTIPAGTFYGLVGPNGAGKTTTLSMIAGLLEPDRGTIHVGGVDAAAKPLAAKRMMGVLPDRLRTFDRLTGRQLLYYYGVLRKLPPAVVESRTADLARAFDLEDALGRSVSDYSAGMLKKVMLAGALIHSPRLLVLDEPFEAVDPVSSAIILDILSTYVAHGGTVILSSHGMDLVERVCTRVAVIVAGQVLAEGTVDEVRGELTLEQRFVELAGGLSDVEGLEWLHTFSD